MPLDEPRAANPPLGARIDYILDATAGGPVALTIRDATGALVRSYRSDAVAQPADPARSHIAPEWLTPELPLAAGPGLHRFVWDLHHPVASALANEQSDDPDDAEEGLWAVPGRYVVELTAGGVVSRQPLVIEADPRVKLSNAVYGRQFRLARDVEATRIEVAEALADAKRIHGAIELREGSAPPSLVAALTRVDERLVAITDFAPEKRTPDSTGRPPVSVAGLRHIAAMLKRLAAAIEGGDTLPTPDAERGYTLYRRLADDALVTWRAFKSADLAELNRQLAASNLTPVGT